MPKEHVRKHQSLPSSSILQLLLAVGIVLLLPACSAVKQQQSSVTRAKTNTRIITIDTADVAVSRRELVRYALTKLGTGYCYGGNGPRCYDCSGFVGDVFLRQGIQLPRSSTEISAMAEMKAVAIQNATAGDLVFFDLVSRGSVSHVGLLVSGTHMIHASTSRGVVIESLESEPFARRIYAIGRLKSPND